MQRSKVDINKVSPMMKEYLKTKKEYEDILLFYRLGDFYELFFEDADLASHELELTLTGKNAGLEERVPMCGVPHHSVQSYIDKLIDKGYKVAICEQIENPKYAKGIVKREVIEVISKGTLTNTSSLNENDFNYIANITDVTYNYIISYADILSGKIYTTYLEHNVEKLISYLENLNIKEIVVDFSFDTKISYILKNNYNILVSHFDEVFDISNTKIFENIDDKKLINSINVIVSYMIKNQKKELTHFQKAEIINSKMFLELSSNTVRNLELVETLRTKERNNSLLGFMDKTKTAMGSRLLKSFIISPSSEKEEIIKRQSLVQLFMQEFLYRQELSDYLYEIYDLERLTGKVACNNVNPRDLLQLMQSIKVIPKINGILKLLKLEELNTFEDLCDLLSSSIDEDAPITIKEGNIIKDGYNEVLDELKSLRKGGKDFISKFESEERERTGIKNLKVGYNKVFGYYIEISKGQIQSIKEEFGYERKQTISNSERFITPLLKEKEDLILNAEEKINSLEYDLFVEIRDRIKKYIFELQQVSNKIAYYDVIQSFSSIAEIKDFVKPTINDNNIIDIKEGRHPVVENVIKEEYISNDIKLNQKEDILIITGPNMSGKSTYMRELAIIVILNQIGSFVPAKSANIPIFDKIFTRIGATDDLVAGQSTFMVEMKESAEALIGATKNSLILFDELGRGTSTYDGMALAGSIIKYISKKNKCKTLFSTHYHELTNLSEELDNVKNVHVSIYENNGNIKFLHKVKEGPVDQSYGINVARLAGLPNEVIISSLEMLKEYEKDDLLVHHTKQISFEIEKKDELREFIDSINPLEITPLEALNVLDQIKNKSKYNN